MKGLDPCYYQHKIQLKQIDQSRHQLLTAKPMRRGHGVQTTLQRNLERENVACRGKLENMASKRHSRMH